MSKKTDKEILMESEQVLNDIVKLNDTNTDTSISCEDVKLEPNQVYIDTIGIITIKPTKIKYFKTGDYNNFMIIKTIGISELIKFDDGESVLNKYLTAVFDKEPTVEFMDNVTTQNIVDIINIANKMNGIKDEDFLAKMERMEMRTV